METEEEVEAQEAELRVVDAHELEVEVEEVEVIELPVVQLHVISGGTICVPCLNDKEQESVAGRTKYPFRLVRCGPV